MSGWLHRVASGTPDTRGQLIAAGVFALIWFVMDAVQWVDWLVLKFRPPGAACQISVNDVLSFTWSQL